jgi:hypothetical protein
MATATETSPNSLGAVTRTERYLTQDQFCEMFAIPARTAERWRVTGDGPPWCRIGPRQIRYRLSDCEKWAAARTFEHRADEIARISAIGTRP